MVADWLMALDEDPFRKAVADESHNRADEELAAALRSPQVCRRWLSVLKLLLVDVNAQFAAKRTDRSAEADEWRRKARRWQGHLLSRKDEARRLCTTQYHGSPEARAESERARRKRGEIGDIALRRLIERHREEWHDILAEEFAAAGVELPRGVVRAQLDGERVSAGDALRVLREAGALRGREQS
jgi:hypothetical protein